ncbi:hypothetical protein C8J57DRAFT_1457985 [Mycena rebaudengoi]|nr:hypothetical protein C8J57DRAFT_1457985 [Mycena rebaudengoi]
MTSIHGATHIHRRITPPPLTCAHSQAGGSEKKEPDSRTPKDALVELREDLGFGLVRGASVGAILTTMRTIHTIRGARGNRKPERRRPTRAETNVDFVVIGGGSVVKRTQSASMSMPAVSKWVSVWSRVWLYHDAHTTRGEAASAGYRPEVEEEDASAEGVIPNADAEGGKADMDVEGWKADADVECGKADVDGENVARKPANASSGLLERGRSTVVVGIEAGSPQPFYVRPQVASTVLWKIGSVLLTVLCRGPFYVRPQEDRDVRVRPQEDRDA